MIIEFFGISGVGKSTICKEICKNKEIKWPRYYLYEKNTWLIRNIKKLFSILFFSIFNIKWLLELNNSINKFKIKKYKDKINLLFNGCSLKIFIEKCKNANEKYIFDEGLYQYMWAIYLRTNILVKKEDIETIFKLFSIPDKLFIITASNETISERLIARGRKTKIIESSDLINKIQKMKKIQDNILKLSKDYLKNTEILFLDTTEGLKDVEKIRI